MIGDAAARSRPAVARSIWSGAITFGQKTNFHRFIASSPDERRRRA
jgi:hypothetical protein